MAHHGGSPFNNDDLKRFFDNIPNLGATNRFPDGKLNENDEGEIIIGVTESEGRIIISFGKPVHWMGLTKEQAIDFANLLLKRATQKMDFLEQLAKAFMVVKYKGCRIEYSGGEFWVLGKPYPTLDEAKNKVDKAKEALRKSIKK